MSYLVGPRDHDARELWHILTSIPEQTLVVVVTVDSSWLLAWDGALAT